LLFLIITITETLFKPQSGQLTEYFFYWGALFSILVVAYALTSLYSLFFSLADKKHLIINQEKKEITAQIFREKQEELISHIKSTLLFSIVGFKPFIDIIFLHLKGGYFKHNEAKAISLLSYFLLNKYINLEEIKKRGEVNQNSELFKRLYQINKTKNLLQDF